MKNLYFLATWSKKRERTWSGTTNGIFNALSSYFEIEDIDLSKYKESIWLKIMKKIAGKGYDMGLSENIRYEKELTKRNIKCGMVFQFADIIKDSVDLKTYIYQDLCVDYVCYMAENLPEVFQCSGFQNIDILQAQKKRSIQNDYLSHCAGVFAMGHWFAKDLIERVGVPFSKVHAVGGGINVDRTSINDTQKNGNKLLFIGRDFKRKGGNVTVEAFKILRQRMPEAELYVAGPQKDPYVKENIEGYHFMGDCDRKTLAALYNKCDVFCMPSYFEAYGLVFIEALTFGLPCIGRNCYEMPYFIEDGVTGYLLNDDNVEQYSNIMLATLQDKTVKENVRNKREYYLHEYSWDAVAERMYKVICHI